MKTFFPCILLAFLGFNYYPENAQVISIAADFAVDPGLPEYKVKVVHQVLTKLKNAKGDYRSRRPYLHFVKETGYGSAVAFPKQGLIQLEEKAYDICTSFGADSLNALANILAHELVHCYEKHDWEEYFAHVAKTSGLGIGVSDQALEDEVQADYLGGFLAYQAGYRTFGIAPEFIERVYKAYNLTDEKLSNYPKKEERKKMAATSEQQLKNLLELFEMGNYLVALEEYDDALEYYLKVLADFQSREIFNNVGVLFTLSALRQFTPTENEFAYPVELDVQSRMRTGTRGSKKEERDQKLIDAIDYFEKARQYDAFYPIAHLNEGCAHALLGLSQREFSQLEWEEAAVAASRAIRLSSESPEWKNTHSDAHVLLGILKAMQKDSAAAEEMFAKAIELNGENFLAKTNQNALRHVMNNILPKQGIDLKNERIDEVNLPTVQLEQRHIKGAISEKKEHQITMVVKPFAASTLLGNVATIGTGSNKINKNTFLQITAEGYKNPTDKGIKLGDDLATVLSKYLEPQSRINLGSGTMLRYNNAKDLSGLIFQFDNAGKLIKWAIFRQVK